MSYNLNPWVTLYFLPKARFLRGAFFAEFSKFFRCKKGSPTVLFVSPNLLGKSTSADLLRFSQLNLRDAINWSYLREHQSICKMSVALACLHLTFIISLLAQKFVFRWIVVNTIDLKTVYSSKILTKVLKTQLNLPKDWKYRDVTMNILYLLKTITILGRKDPTAEFCHIKPES